MSIDSRDPEIAVDTYPNEIDAKNILRSCIIGQNAPL